MDLIICYMFQIKEPAHQLIRARRLPLIIPLPDSPPSSAEMTGD